MYDIKNGMRRLYDDENFWIIDYNGGKIVPSACPDDKQ